MVGRSRCFALELYPENEKHWKILNYIITYFEYAYILHDKDVFDEDVIDEDTKDIIHKVGEVKKPHWHIIICFKNQRSIKSLKEELGLAHIETCNFYAYSRYLIHKDSPKKFQYRREDIHTNIELRVNNALSLNYNQAEQDTRILYNYIISQNFITFRQLTDYAMQNDCLLELKKNVYFYKQFCDDYSGFRRF